MYSYVVMPCKIYMYALSKSQVITNSNKVNLKKFIKKSQNKDSRALF